MERRVVVTLLWILVLGMGGGLVPPAYGETQREEDFARSGLLTDERRASGPYVREIRVLAEKGGRVDWSKANDRIAFSRKGTDGYYDVYTMNP